MLKADEHSTLANLNFDQPRRIADARNAILGETMSRKLVVLSRIFASSVMIYFFTSSAVLGQVVDPCRYGCPKEGCPCGGGGPIGNKESEGANGHAKSEPVTGTDKRPGNKAVGDKIKNRVAKKKAQAEKVKQENTSK